MRCPVCERAELVEQAQNYHYRECGLNNVILAGITVRICPECGALTPKIPKIEALHDCIAHALVKKEERLTHAYAARKETHKVVSLLVRIDEAKQQWTDEWREAA